MRETVEDRAREARLLGAMAKHLCCSFTQCQNLTKYRIDGWFYLPRSEGDLRGEILGWAECKWYGDGKSAFCALNVPKYDELIRLSSLTGKPSYFIFREQGRWGYIVVQDGDLKTPFKLVQTGGTPKGREPNPDDIEPLIMFDKDYIYWGS